MLATGAVVGTSSGLTDLFYHPATAQAGFAGSVINPGLDLETARPAIAMNIIANTAAAGRNRIRQGLPDGFDEHGIARPTDPIGRSQG